MSEVRIDSALFAKRVKEIQQALGSTIPTKSLLIVSGKFDEANPYTKTAAIFIWLLGYEFPSTALAITPERVVFVLTAKKAEHIAELKDKGLVEIWTRNKEADHNKKLFEDLADLLKDQGDVGVITKDKFDAPFTNEWKNVWEDKKDKTEQVDVAPGLATILEVKDAEELRSIRYASKCSLALLTDYFFNEMASAVDEEKRITHSQLSDKIEKKIDDFEYFKALKISSELDPAQLDWCYSPIVQSQDYDLKPSAVSNNKPLKHTGVILCSLGMRYKSYCSNIGRSYLINPNKQQEESYEILVSLQQYLLDDVIKAGVSCKSVYEAALAFVKEKAPAQEKHFIKSCGWGIGIEFRDTSLALSMKNTDSKLLKDGMTLNLIVGFSDLLVKKQPYSLFLIDTIKVTGEKPVVFTASPKGLKDISLYLKDEDDAVKVEEVQPKGNGRASRSNVLKSRLRDEDKASDDSENRRKLHQTDLHEKLQKEGLERFADATGTVDSGPKVVFKKFESYKREEQLPLTKDLRIHVDTKAQTILVPINGRPVPFHISAYKSGSKNEEGEYTYLRLNFHSPGQAGSGKKDDVPFEDPSANFLRSITLRSKDGDRMNQVFKKIGDLKKDAVKREQEKKEMADVVEQGSLVPIRNARPVRLDNAFVRPGPEGKRVAGVVEIHENGLRYSSPGQQKIDVLFSNIQHLFFQPCDHELIALVHCHLKSPIIVGKKKTKDIQFYREATDIQFDETGNRRRKYRYGDEDELEQEQEERRRRQQLNNEFEAFANKISDASRTLEVDRPFRKLGFEGVPFRSAVFCQPTIDCLVQLIDPPFTVITLSEIELCHFERVQFGLRQFDLVFVYKDFTKPVTHINSIPMIQIDAVKDWLNESDIPYYEGPVNLTWPTIMKTVADDPHEFFKTGGWSFLSIESDDEDGEESEEEDAFSPSDEDPSDESVSDQSEESDYSESGSEEDDEEEEGEDWDALEEKAEREDRKRNR